MERLVRMCATSGGCETSLFCINSMFWSVVFIILYSTSTVLSQEQEQLRLGVMLPEYQPGMRHWPYFTQMVQPGIDIALGKVQETILPKHNVSYLALDTRCSNQMSMILSVHMKYKYECDVFLGPACEYAVAPTARFCDYWDVPLITAGALAQGFSKDYFNTITRMQGSYDKFAYSLVEFFERQNWNTTILLVDEPIDGEIKDCFFCMGGVSWTFHEHEIAHEVEGFDQLTEDSTKQLLEKVEPVARIVVMCASDDAIRKIMLAAHDLGMTNGEYAFINIKLFDSNYFGNNKLVWHREGDTAEENERAKQAFRALMTFTLRKPNTPAYAKFAEDVKERARRDYNFDFDAVNETIQNTTDLPRRP
ncbi:atrial natriuretic peptide receptor 3-like [Amphiura filiformis]|uniref:atrial natriuretic peptide receptor 3-like n=1 Tax=Amphiura filiformis TaxID=82378 RepID=UPI003B21F892